MNRISFFLFIIALFPMIYSCAALSKKPVEVRNDPLIGKIIDTSKRNTIDFDTLMEQIKTFDVIYLSEKHDNPDHHQYQENIIQALIQTGETVTIGFEFFAMDHTPNLLNFMDSGNASHTPEEDAFIEKDLRKKLGWDTQSDTMWSYYFNLLKLAKKHQLPVAGLDLASSVKKRVTRKGIDGISSIESEMIFSTQFENPAYKSYMFSIFKAVHCGMGGENMQSRLYDTWTARNDKMAHSITSLYKYAKGPVVVIIGGGHTEYALGVINRVNAINKNISQVNVGLKEISVSSSELDAYLEPLDLEGFDPLPPYDYIWFSQRVSYTDPCVEFKKTIEKMKSRK